MIFSFLCKILTIRITPGYLLSKACACGHFDCYSYGMSKTTKTVARYAANALPIYRVYAGYRTAERLRTDMKDARKRTWSFSRRVLLDTLTDTLDGQLARHAGPTRLGGYLDQLGDKAWFLQITRQLVSNGELQPNNFAIPAVRDIGFLAVRTAAQYYGLKTDATASGKLKMVSQVGAAVTACSPLASSYPEFTRDLYALATGASAASGLEMLQGYAGEIAQQYRSEPIAQLIVASAAYIAASAPEAA